MKMGRAEDFIQKFGGEVSFWRLGLLVRVRKIILRQNGIRGRLACRMVRNDLILDWVLVERKENSRDRIG